MTSPLLPLAPERLGPAARVGAYVAVALSADGASWRVTWAQSAREHRQAVARVAGGPWSESASIPAGNGPAAPGPSPDGPPGLLCEAPSRSGPVALRTGRRVIGERPVFPGAGLVLSRRSGGAWVDVAFADETPDEEIFAAAIAARGDELVAVWIADDGEGGAVCRALRHTPGAAPAADAWRQYPAFPLQPGVAAVMAGRHAGALLAAGGANFPDRPPWEGGVKRTYDEIYVLPDGATSWRTAGRLPVPRAYAAVVTIPSGVLAIGGENASGVFADSLLFTWSGSEVVIRPAPALPVSLASPVAVVLDGKVYLAGGYAAGTPRVSTASFYCLDLAQPAAGWQALPAWPGPSRALAVIAALEGAVYLISGLEMQADAGGQPLMNYLTDAYRYRPGEGWERLPDLPWSVIAAPSPAPVTTAPARVFVFGGVDGRQVGKMPRDRRVPEDILYFDVARHAWRLWKEAWPEPVVSSPVVPVDGEWIFVSGEIKAGHRTTAVVGWRPV